MVTPLTPDKRKARWRAKVPGEFFSYRGVCYQALGLDINGCFYAVRLPDGAMSSFHMRSEFRAAAKPQKYFDKAALCELHQLESL